MNARNKERTAERHRKGLCRCGSKAEKGVKMCKVCLLKARDAARAAYRIKQGIPVDAPLKNKGRKPTIPNPKRRVTKARTNIVSGVTRHVNRDGYGREDTWYRVSSMAHGKHHQRKWSVSKYGEDGAKLAATLQKMLWNIELGLWNPEDGDPLSVLSYRESFEGNRDYEDCVVTDVSSPWIQEYDDED